MSKLVDFDELTVILDDAKYEASKYDGDAYWAAKEIVKEIRSSVDTVDEIVCRCGQCRFASHTAVCYCKRFEMVRDEDWYCADGVTLDDHADMEPGDRWVRSVQT